MEFFLKSSIFDRERKLTVDPDYLEFDDNDLAASPPSKFLKKEIEGLRYGVKAIRGYRFYIGRVYCVDIKSDSGQVIKIRLKSIYRIRRKRLAVKYVKIVESLFKYYFNAISSNYLDLFRSNNPFEILGVTFTAEGICFDEKIGVIAWDFVGTKKYQTYYSLFSELDPNQYKAFNYVDEWNAAILHSVTEGILKWKFPIPKQKSEIKSLKNPEQF